jgi:hypothetical protein
MCPFAGIGGSPETPIFVTAVTIGTYSDPSPPLSTRPLLGPILAERGLIDPDRLAEALAEGRLWDEFLAGRGGRKNLRTGDAPSVAIPTIL